MKKNKKNKRNIINKIIPRKARYAWRETKHAWQRLTKGYDKSLSWDLGYSSIEQMKIGLDYYLQDAPKIIDLSYHKIEYRGTTYTLEQLLKIFQQIATYIYLNYYDYTWSTDTKYKKIFEDNLAAYMELYNLLLFYLWW